MDAFEYEKFLAWAFGITNNGIPIDRYGDPAQMADTDSFCEENLDSVKAVVAYAMRIYWVDIINKTSIRDSDCERLKNFIALVIQSKTLDEISQLITGFNDSFVERYYKRGDGRIQFGEQ